MNDRHVEDGKGTVESDSETYDLVPGIGGGIDLLKRKSKFG